MRVLGKDCTLSINGRAIIGGFQASQVITLNDFEQEFGTVNRGVQQLETLPRRERNWLAGYLEIKEKLSSTSFSHRQWKKMNESHGDRVYPATMWRRLEHAAVTFFGWRCEGKIRHPKRIGERMAAKLATLSGESFWNVTETLFSFQVGHHPTPSEWHRIWTGE